MKQYTALFLDLDQTLLNFNAAEVYSFYHTCAAYGLPEDPTLLADYQRINNAYWVQLEQGLITKTQLLERRFVDLFALRGITGVDPSALNRDYLDNQALHTLLLDGAEEVCRILSQEYPLYIASNGVSRTQASRLAATPLLPYLSGVVVSEDAGYEKPDPRFFHHAFAAYGFTDPSSLLMIGDSLTADMAGGAAAGMDTCWYNPEGKSLTGPVTPTYSVGHLLELLPLFCQSPQK